MIKKVTFGETESIVPSKFCEKFSYTEGEIKYPVSKIFFKVNRRGCVLELPMIGGEQFFGGGLQLHAFNLTGKKIVTRVNSDPTAPTGDSHAPVPFFVSTAGYGIYFDTARYAEFEFGKKKPLRVQKNFELGQVFLDTAELYKAEDTDDSSVISVQIPVAKGIDIYIIEGENITDVVSQYNMLSGGGCSVPDWGFGVYYRCCGTYTQEQVRQKAEYFRTNDIPCEVIGLEPGWQTRGYSCSFMWDKTRYPEPKELICELYEKGYHVNLWEHAFVHPESPMYEKLTDYCGDYAVWNGLVPDFTMEEAKKSFVEHHKKFVTFGKVDGYKLDECDSGDFLGGWSFPNASEFPGGADGEQYHSLFGTLYMQTMLRAIEGTETYSQVRCAGALCSSYPYVLYSDLYNHKEFIRGVVTAGFSGLLWSPELRHADSKEELLRRLQAVVFSAQCMINAWYCDDVPWKRYDCEDEVRTLLKERANLLPRLKKAFKRYQEKGVPPIRALVCDYTDDKESHSIDDEYMLGDDMLVAPIAAGETKREVYLPKGKWKNYFTGEPVESGRFEVETESIPVYVKEF